MLLWFERLLWCAGVAALGFFIFGVGEANISQYRLNRKFEDVLAAKRPLTTQPPKAENVPAASTTSREMTAPYLARLEIPRLDMSLIVLEGIDNGTLRRGIGHIPGTALPGESGNAGI